MVMDGIKRGGYSCINTISRIIWARKKMKNVKLAAHTNECSYANQSG